MKNTKVNMNKPVYLGLLILEISKTLIYEFWYDYTEPRYQNNAKLCYMHTYSFVIQTLQNVYEGITDTEKKYDTSNYDVDRPWPVNKNKKLISLIKDDLGGKMLT